MKRGVWGALVALLSTVAFSSSSVAADPPQFQVDPFWPRPLPNNWLLGQVASVAVGPDDHVWLLQRPRSLTDDEKGATLKPPRNKCCAPAPSVMEFDSDGNFIQGWGFPQTTPWVANEHGIHVDKAGFVWIAGNNANDSAIFKYTKDGKPVLTIGKLGPTGGSNDTTLLGRPADVQVDDAAREVFVADGYGNHRVIVFDADTGAFKRTWGAFGKPPGGKDNCAIARLTEFLPGDGLPDFNVAHSIRVSNDGTVYLADRENRRVPVFSSDGKFVKQLRRVEEPFAANLAFSPDREQQFLYVGGGKAITVVDRKTFEVAGRVQVEKQLGGGHHIATDSKGNLYVAQTAAGMQRLLFNGMSGAAVR
jgi:DNA-binding beta-propeller fold protein YncE